MDLNQPLPIELGEFFFSKISIVRGPKMKWPSIFSLLAYELRKKYSNRHKCLNMEKLSNCSDKAICNGVGALVLSTEEVFKAVRARFSKYPPQNSNDLPRHPNDLLDEDCKNVELV